MSKAIAKILLLQNHADIDDKKAESIIAAALGHNSFDDSSPSAGKIHFKSTDDYDNMSLAERKTAYLNMLQNISLDPRFYDCIPKHNSYVANILGYESAKDADKELSAKRLFDIHSFDEHKLLEAEDYFGSPAYCRPLFGVFHSNHATVISNEMDNSTRFIENELTLLDLSKRNNHMIVIVTTTSQPFRYSRSICRGIDGYQLMHWSAETINAIRESQSGIVLFMLEEGHHDISKIVQDISEARKGQSTGIVLNGLTGEFNVSQTELEKYTELKHNILYHGNKPPQTIWDAGSYHYVFPHQFSTINTEIMTDILAIQNGFGITCVDRFLPLCCFNKDNNKKHYQNYPIVPDEMMDRPPTLFERLVTRNTNSSLRFNQYE